MIQPPAGRVLRFPAARVRGAGNSSGTEARKDTGLRGGRGRQERGGSARRHAQQCNVILLVCDVMLHTLKRYSRPVTSISAFQEEAQKIMIDYYQQTELENVKSIINQSKTLTPVKGQPVTSKKKM